MSDFVDWTMSSEPSHKVPKPKQKPASEMKRKSGPKLRESCDECSNAKVRCSKDKPVCRRCNAKGRTCTYGLSARSGRRQMRNRTATNSAGSECSGSSATHLSSGAGCATQSDPFSSVPWHELSNPSDLAACNEKAFSQGQALSDSIVVSPPMANSTASVSDLPFDFTLSGAQSTSPRCTTSPDTHVPPAAATVCQAHDTVVPLADDSWSSTIQTVNAFGPPTHDDIFNDVCFSPEATTHSSPSVFDDESCESQSPPTSEDSCGPLSTLFEDSGDQPDTCALSTLRAPCTELIERAPRRCDCIARVLGVLNEHRRKTSVKGTSSQNLGSQQDGNCIDQMLLNTCNSALECGCLEKDQRTCSLLMCTFMDIMARAARNDGNGRVDLKRLISFVDNFSQALKRTEGCYTQWRDSPFINFWKVTEYSC
ncbi:hypothetical protein EJ03DRAFT_166066 [Teratosphaeria nubilosa]|uniref:Zn(2)-C6 fungal-type domain-containing protein n=1 Tax=Teratosphaeria nubilosa TaxID=161662 RepID=A0A6G1L1V7_9PEZI|nr:hypothetical protein EJ03DRAFT_166066 [Teratosphaeria nubilosa]